MSGIEAAIRYLIQETATDAFNEEHSVFGKLLEKLTSSCFN